MRILRLDLRAIGPLECGDLSPLWAAIDNRRRITQSRIVFAGSKRRKAAPRQKESGDESPHSKGREGADENPPA